MRNTGLWIGIIGAGAVGSIIMLRKKSANSTPTSTSGSGSTPTSTSGSGSTPTSTSGSGSTPTSTSGSGSTPTSTSGSGSTQQATYDLRLGVYGSSEQATGTYIQFQGVTEVSQAYRGISIFPGPAVPQQKVQIQISGAGINYSTAIRSDSSGSFQVSTPSRVTGMGNLVCTAHWVDPGGIVHRQIVKVTIVASLPNFPKEKAMQIPFNAAVNKYAIQSATDAYAKQLAPTLPPLTFLTPQRPVNGDPGLIGTNGVWFPSASDVPPGLQTAPLVMGPYRAVYGVSY